MHRLAVRRNDGHAMALDRHLSGTDRCERVNQTETVTATGRYGKDLQRCVCHKASIRVTELTSSVDQHRLGVLAGVHCQTARVSFSGIFVQPITDEHDVCRQIKVV